MYLTTPLVLLAADVHAADLYAKGFIAGVGKFLLFGIIILVLIGVFIGFKARGRR